MKKELIYVAHPYSNDPEGNIAQVTEFMKSIQKTYPNSTFVTPLHMFNYHEGIISYEETMDHCLSFLEKCDLALFPEYYNQSKGCMTELQFCKQKGIPAEVISFETLEKKSIEV